LKVLIIKTSSLGDLIHTLPALTDAMAAIPGVRFDWVAEESFCEIPGWHPAVERVIPVTIRRWRRDWIGAWRSGEMGEFRRNLRLQEYDLVLDAQGLYKSALLARMAHGVTAGLDAGSAREPGAARLYRKRVRVEREMHAIERVRSLFAQALGYGLPDSDPDYGIRLDADPTRDNPYLAFLHGTTWTTKLWPLEYWVELARDAGARGYQVLLPWGSAEEQERAEQIRQQSGVGKLLPRMTLTGMAQCLAGAAGVVGVDSGLAHLAAALSVPAVTLYGPTRTDLTGARGRLQTNLQAQFECAPCMRRECGYTGHSEVNPACFAQLPPEAAWSALQARMDEVTA
jgi:heptosyltransferase I